SKVLYEQVLHGVVLSEKSPQVTREPEGVDRLKGAVLEPFQSIRIVLRVEIEDELVRPVAHSLAELRHLREDGLAAAPGEEGSVSPGPLRMAGIIEAVRDRDRVRIDEARSFVVLHDGIEIGHRLYRDGHVGMGSRDMEAVEKFDGRSHLEVAAGED